MDAPATEVLERLMTAPVRPRGFLAGASNHTLLVQVGAASEGLHAVYKPRAGERPLWDFPPGTLCAREVAAFEVSAFLGWDLVPPTVLRGDAPMGAGSLQLFVPHDPEQHYFVLLEDPAWHAGLARMALFDLLTNNADRKASHVLLADGGRLLGCDHGLTFHVEPKVRTVIWEFGGRPVEAAARTDLGRLAAALRAGGGPGQVPGDGDHAGLRARLEGLLAPAEIGALAQRAGVLRDLAALPEMPRDRRPYPWPPL